MDTAEVLLFVSLEITVLLGIAVVLLNRNRRKLQDQLQELIRVNASPGKEAFDSITSGYLPYLENLILASRNQLEESNSTETKTADPTVDAIRYHLSFLEAEKKVVELCNDFPDKRWEHITELFTPPAEPTGEDGNADATTTQNTGEKKESDEGVASELAEQLDKQKKKIFELHHLIDDLNLEAEKAEALQEKLDQFELASRDMNMCIQVLEEENGFLQEQIRSLLQLDNKESVYKADA